MWDIDYFFFWPNDWLEALFERETFRAIQKRHSIIKRDQFSMGARSRINRGRK